MTRSSEWPLTRSARPRRYVPRALLLAARPLFRHSASRDAYVLRLVGSRYGPVMRPERRDRRTRSPDLALMR